ncbi:MAG: HlyD family efflux transporter periplasmic adaptor subunit [Coriobacteriia bacterium]|nr:HlyD family efflux transporter periplasmic adaptor subunit [Coriobacteriia bacterium]
MSLSKGIRRYRGWIAAGMLVVVAGTAYVLMRGGSEAESTISYQTEAASVGTISSTVSGTGTLAVGTTTDVYPETGGTVASLAVAEGSVVATGDVLFTIDPADAEAASAQALVGLRQAQQSVTQAGLQLTKAKSTLSTLYARSAEPTPTVTSADIAAAEGDVAVAKAQVASANAQVAAADDSYDEAVAAEDDLTVTAPCSGQVYTLSVEVGDSVSTSSGSTGSATTSGATSTMGATTTSASSSTAPVVMAPEQPLMVHLTVNEVDLPTLEIGQRADIGFDAFTDITATGKIYEIADEGTNSSGVVTFDVYVSIDKADPRLRPGMSASATIVTDVAQSVLVVSNSAVQSDGDGGYYVLLMSDGAAESSQVTVETGLASDTQTEILSGIAEGDMVVTQTIDSSDESDIEDNDSGSGLLNFGGGGGMGGGTPPSGGPMGGQ